MPPFTDLRSVQTLIDGDRLKFVLRCPGRLRLRRRVPTPGTSPPRCWSSSSCRYVVVGHSERRRSTRARTTTLVNAKTLKALAKGLAPIVCVGEGLDTFARPRDHVELHPRVMSSDGPHRRCHRRADQPALVIAYEPVWAIGYGPRWRRPEDAQEVCGAIRRLGLGALPRGAGGCEQVRVLYGGSVNAQTTCVAMMAQPDRGRLSGRQRQPRRRPVRGHREILRSARPLSRSRRSQRSFLSPV